MRNLKSEYRFNRIFIAFLICFCFARGAGFAVEGGTVVSVKVDGAQVFIAGCIVNVDGVVSFIDVEQFAVGTGLHLHAGASRKLLPVT